MQLKTYEDVKKKRKQVRLNNLRDPGSNSQTHIETGGHSATKRHGHYKTNEAVESVCSKAGEKRADPEDDIEQQQYSKRTRSA